MKNYCPSFQLFKQSGFNDCGYACLQMLCKHYDIDFALSLDDFNKHLTPQGLDLLTFTTIAEDLGFYCSSQQGTFNEFLATNSLPCVVLWREVHLVVVYEITATEIRIADPSIGYIETSYQLFQHYWNLKNKNTGIVITFKKR